MPNVISRSFTDTRYRCYGLTPRITEHLLSSHADPRLADAETGSAHAHDPQARFAQIAIGALAEACRHRRSSAIRS